MVANDPAVQGPAPAERRGPGTHEPFFPEGRATIPSGTWAGRFGVTGIYCIEADWDGPYSVEQPLRFLTEAHKADFEFHGRVRSSTQFGKALRGWVERTDWEYPLLYLGFHGFERGVQVGRGSAPCETTSDWSRSRISWPIMVTTYSCRVA